MHLLRHDLAITPYMHLHRGRAVLEGLQLLVCEGRDCSGYSSGGNHVPAAAAALGMICLPHGDHRGAAVLALAVEPIVVTLGPVEPGCWQINFAVSAYLNA